MKLDDVNAMAAAYQADLLPLRAVATALLMFRRQKKHSIDLADLMARTGATKGACSKAIAAAVKAVAMMGEGFQIGNGEVSKSETTGFQNGNDCFQIGNGEFPNRKPLPIREREIQEREREQASNAGGRESTPEPSTYPNGPSPESEWRPVVEMVERQTAGSLGYWAQAACREYPARWVDLLARRKILGAREQPRVQLLNAILQRWAAEGACEYEPPAPAPATLPITAVVGESPPRSLPPAPARTFRQIDRDERAARLKRDEIEYAVRERHGLDWGPLTDAARAELEALLCTA